MRQRGRKSEAANAMRPIVDGTPAMLEPPPHLTAKESEVFRQVVLTAPPAQFRLSDVLLLSTFSQITALLQTAARSAANANDKTKQAKFKMLAELAKTQSVLATKLRLAPQSRTSSITAARQADKHRPSFYEQMLPEEWQ